MGSLTFLLPTVSAHRVMDAQKEEAIEVLNNNFASVYDDVFARLLKVDKQAKKLDDEVRLMNNIREMMNEVSGRSIWPFNLKVIGQFGGIVILPVIPILFETVF